MWYFYFYNSNYYKSNISTRLFIKRYFQNYILSLFYYFLITFTLYWEHLHKNKAFLTCFDYSNFRDYDSSKEMDDLFTPRIGPEKPILTFDIFALLGSPVFHNLPLFRVYLVPKHSDNDLQRIFKAISEAWTPATTAPLPESPREWPLKRKFLNMYQNKNHIECYNFCQYCKHHFAIAKAKSLNCILFATSFL